MGGCSQGPLLSHSGNALVRNDHFRQSIESKCTPQPVHIGVSLTFFPYGNAGIHKEPKTLLLPVQQPKSSLLTLLLLLVVASKLWSPMLKETRYINPIGFIDVTSSENRANGRQVIRNEGSQSGRLLARPTFEPQWKCVGQK